MDDTTKVANLVANLRNNLRNRLEHCEDGTSVMVTPRECELLLAHLDGEQERLAAAREEQREACAKDAEERVTGTATHDEIRGVSLTARPLADRLAAAEARVAELEKALADAVAIAREFDTRGQEAVAALRDTTEALESSFPGDESVGLPEFPEVSLTEAWKRRERARAVLAKYPEGK